MFVFVKSVNKKGDGKADLAMMTWWGIAGRGVKRLYNGDWE